MRREIIRLTKKLIEFQTTEDCPEEKDRCFDFIQDYFKDSQAVIKRVRNKSCNAIVISNSKSRRVDLMLNGHIDVVAGQDTQFRPTEKNSKVYGRGAIDMKGSVAVMLYFIKNIIDQNSKQSISLMIVGDEEIPFPNSTQYLLERFDYQPKFAIVGEETGFDIAVNQKGSLNLIFEYEGESAHSSFPEQGVNAVERLISAFLELKKIAILNSDKNFSSTICLSALNGGDVINSVPNKGIMKINIRFVDKASLRAVLKKVKELQSKDKRLKATVCEQGGIMRAQNSEKQLQELEKIVVEVVNKRPRLIKTSTSSDARYFSEQGLPVIVFGPKGKNYHKENEYVDISSLEQYLRILKKLSLNLIV